MIRAVLADIIAVACLFGSLYMVAMISYGMGY